MRHNYVCTLSVIIVSVAIPSLIFLESLIKDQKLQSSMSLHSSTLKHLIKHFSSISTRLLSTNSIRDRDLPTPKSQQKQLNLKQSNSNFNSNMVRSLGQQEAIKIDEELFNDYKFSVDQLMELAGLSVASTIASVYGSLKESKIVIVCGPGNNGGDGMVAARHLKLFGFNNVTLLSARKPTKDLFVNLVRQAELNDVSISYDATPFINDPCIGLIVDALFGFSFKPPVRPDFEPLMAILTNAFGRKTPIVAVDIPSGWDVEKGPPDNKSLYFMPDTLVSLTAPKLCSNYFTGPNHFLGGRFVPRQLQEKYSLNLPQYPGIDCIVRL